MIKNIIIGCLVIISTVSITGWAANVKRSLTIEDINTVFVGATDFEISEESGDLIIKFVPIPGPGDPPAYVPNNLIIANATVGDCSLQ